MVLTGGYASPGTRARRKAAAELGRVGGIDGNVSNLSVVSFPDTFDPADAEIQATRAELTDTERAAVEKARRKERGRKRALDRSAGQRTRASTGRRSGSRPALNAANKPDYPRVKCRSLVVSRRHTGLVCRSRRTAGMTCRPVTASTAPVSPKPPRPRRSERPPRPAHRRAHHHRPTAQTSSSKTATYVPGTACGAKPCKPPRQAGSPPPSARMREGRRSIAAAHQRSRRSCHRPACAAQK